MLKKINSNVYVQIISIINVFGLYSFDGLAGENEAAEKQREQLTKV